MGVCAVTVAFRGLWPMRAISPTTAPALIVATWWPPVKMPASPSSTRKHSTPTSPWSIRMAPGSASTGSPSAATRSSSCSDIWANSAM